MGGGPQAAIRDRRCPVPPPSPDSALLHPGYKISLLQPRRNLANLIRRPLTRQRLARLQPRSPDGGRRPESGATVGPCHHPPRIPRCFIRATKSPYFNPAAILRISSADRSPASGSRGSNPVARMKAEGRNPGPPLHNATTLPGFRVASSGLQNLLTSTPPQSSESHPPTAHPPTAPAAANAAPSPTRQSTPAHTRYRE